MLWLKSAVLQMFQSSARLLRVQTDGKSVAIVAATLVSILREDFEPPNAMREQGPGWTLPFQSSARILSLQTSQTTSSSGMPTVSILREDFEPPNERAI